MTKKESIADMFGLTDDALGMDIIDLNISQLQAFPNHPYVVTDDEEMEKLEKSIKLYGIQVPLLVRPAAEIRGYEIISGHRRFHAATKIGLHSVPAKIIECDDDQATVLMVDSNLQRQNISLKEKILSLSMKYEALKHQGVRGGSSLERMSMETGENYKSLQRLIALSNLTPELLDIVGTKKLNKTMALALAKLPQEEQIAAFDKAVNEAEEHKKKKTKKLWIDLDFLYEYFSKDTPEEAIRGQIMVLVDEWAGSEYPG